MNQPDDRHADDLRADALAVDALPRHTTPTWEVELLISGVAVFAMLQLPGWLDDQLFALMPRFGANMSEPLQVMYLYTKTAAVILAITFSLHLLLRAHWIALVGMHSVHPEGVRWDKLRIGPVQRQLDAERVGNVPASIERADNRATIVFALGVQLASTLLVISLVLALLFSLAMAVFVLAGVRPDAARVFTWCVTGLLLPFALAPLIDRRFGKRLRPGGLAQRTLAGTYRAYARIGLSRNSSVMALLASHSNERKVTISMVAVMFVIILGVSLSLKSLRNPERIGGYSLFPDRKDLPARAINPATYDQQRNPARDAAVPYVQNIVVSGPYLQVVVPYDPDRDDAALRRDCAAMLRIASQAGRAAATLDCLQRLHPLRLDGKAVESLRYDIASDPRTDRPALVAMVDVRALAPGRHELQVARAAAPDDKRPGASAPYRIPFWR
jgi:hypothetical protein